MSRTTIAVAHADGYLHNAKDFSNSWGSAAFVWTALASKYRIGADENGLFGTHYKSSMPSFDAWDAVWKYHNEGKPLTPWEANTLVTTYDKMVLFRKDIPVVAESFRRFADAHSVPTQVCTLVQQAAFLDEAYAAGAVAVAWNQTSVSEEWYSTYNGDEDDSQAYNVLTGTTHNTADILPI